MKLRAPLEEFQCRICKILVAEKLVAPFYAMMLDSRDYDMVWVEHCINQSSCLTTKLHDQLLLYCIVVLRPVNI